MSYICDISIFCLNSYTASIENYVLEGIPWSKLWLSILVENMEGKTNTYTFLQASRAVILAVVC